MPNGLWCQSDPIVKLSTEYGHARLRLLIGSKDSPEQPPSKLIIMDLTVPQDVSVAILKNKDDPRLPVGFDVTNDDDTQTSKHQATCILYVDTPEELDDATLEVTVVDQHKNVLASGVIDPDGETDLTLPFVVTFRAESDDEQRASDLATDTWA